MSEEDCISNLQRTEFIKEIQEHLDEPKITMKQLRDLAKQFKIRRYSSLNKAELLELLENVLINGNPCTVYDSDRIKKRKEYLRQYRLKKLVDDPNYYNNYHSVDRTEYQRQYYLKRKAKRLALKEG